MTEPRSELERGAETSEQAQGKGRSVLRPTALSVRRVLFVLMLIALTVLAIGVMDALRAPDWSQALVQGMGIGAAWCVITRGGARR